MAATIRFPDGLEATLLDEEGTWVCADKEMEELFHLQTRHHIAWRGGASPVAPIKYLAIAMAEILEAEIIHLDPEPDGAYGDLEPYLSRRSKDDGDHSPLEPAP